MVGAIQSLLSFLMLVSYLTKHSPIILFKSFQTYLPANKSYMLLTEAERRVISFIYSFILPSKLLWKSWKKGPSTCQEDLLGLENWRWHLISDIYMSLLSLSLPILRLVYRRISLTFSRRSSIFCTWDFPYVEISFLHFSSASICSRVSSKTE